MASGGKARCVHGRKARGGGRKLCDTIVLDNTIVPIDEEVDPVPELQSSTTSVDPSTIILAEETDSEGDSGDDESTLKLEQNSISGAQAANNLDRHLEQWSKSNWQLPRFIGNIKQYLDNESKYSYENEVVPVRTSLIQTGDQLCLHSTFIANLYFNEVCVYDHNHNAEGEVNLNLPDGARFMAKSPQQLMAMRNDDILMTVTLKLVEHHSNNEPAYFHCKIILENSKGKVASYVQCLTSVKNGAMQSMARPLNIKELEKMAPDDELRITLDLCVYRPPIQWGLPSDEIRSATSFMGSGYIDKRKLALELAQKFEQKGLTGISVCLKSLPIRERNVRDTI